MKRQSYPGYRVLDEKKLVEEYSLKARERRRCLLSFLALMATFALLFLAYFPILLNKMVPILWVHEANMFGLTPAIQESLLRLLANGRIQVLKGYISIILCTLAIIPAWMCALLYIHRKSAIWHGGALSLKYWREFYLIKPFRVHTFSSSKPAKSTAREARTETKNSPA